MNTNQLREITIVAPASLEAELCGRLREWRVPSYSVIESLNNPSRACHSGEIEGTHIQIIALVRSEIAAEVLQGLQSDFFSEPSLVYFVSDAAGPSGATTQRLQTPGKQVLMEEKWGDYLITL
jgi:hypothetical protein